MSETMEMILEILVLALVVIHFIIDLTTEHKVSKIKKHEDNEHNTTEDELIETAIEEYLEKKEKR